MRLAPHSMPGLDVMKNIEQEIQHSLEILASPDSFAVPERMSRKKWNGEWWHLVTICEMGYANRIPTSVARKALEQLKYGAWPKFVITKEDAPRTRADRAKMDCCHCELGVYYMVLCQCGCDVDRELPWIRDWFLKHQLDDGGLNCTPTAYLNSRKSSVVSTLPPLEAILLFTDRSYTEAEARFLDEGARYLIEHRLVESKRESRIINQEWLKPLFPRFFEYDILRGLSYLSEWSRRRNKPLPKGLIEEGLDRMKSFVKGSEVFVGRHVNDRSSDWRGGTFPLLKSVSKVGKVSPYLTNQLTSILATQ